MVDGVAKKKAIRVANEKLLKSFFKAFCVTRAITYYFFYLNHLAHTKAITKTLLTFAVYWTNPRDWRLLQGTRKHYSSSSGSVFFIRRFARYDNR